MKISIAMATYNGGKYIEEQIKSFIAQTVRPDELVITDDGSTDDTLKIVKSLARVAPFDIRIERNSENLGYAQNFGKAVALCTGDIIFFSDQDDVWLPEKLARVRAEFDAQPDIQVVINDTRIVHGDLRDTGLTKLGQIRSLGLKDSSFITGCCSAIRSEFRDLLLPIPDHIFVHDTWLHALGDILAVRSLIDEPLQLYRRHGLNASQALESATNPLGKKDLFRAYLDGDNREYTERSIQKIDLLRQRIHGGMAAEGSAPYGRFVEAMSQLENRQVAARRRLDVLSHRRIARISPAVSMYLRGQYSQFSGWRSMAKDLLKP